MGFLSSILYRFIKKQPIPTEAYPVIKKQFYYSKTPTSVRIRQQKLERVATTNRITYGEESYVILRVDHFFNGEVEGINIIHLSFDLNGVEDLDLDLVLNIPLTSNQILPGNYKCSEENKEYCMEGSLSFDYDEDEKEEYEKEPVEEINLLGGRVEVCCLENDIYRVTGECICEDKNKLMIQYEGPFYFSNGNPGPNGTGSFLYQEKEYPLITASENYTGLWSEYVSDVDNIADYWLDRWSDHIQIQFEVEEETEDFDYFLRIYFAQPEGKQIHPGMYACTPNKYTPSFHMPMNSCTVSVGIFPKEDVDKGDVFVIQEGNVEVIRGETLTIKGEGRLNNEEPFSFYYQGIPEWYDDNY